MSNDQHSFLTLEGNSEGLFRDRGSKFLAYAAPAGTEEEALEFIDAIRREHPKARHHCFAYRLGQEGALFRANDDGEPSGTAGRPILGQIDRLGLTNVVVVVVRYFGGALLGTSGLIQAYKKSAADALEQAVLVEKKVLHVYRIGFEYGLMSKVMEALKKNDIPILHQHFKNEAFVEAGFDPAGLPEQLYHLQARIFDLHPEEVDARTPSPGLDIRFIRSDAR